MARKTAIILGVAFLTLAVGSAVWAQDADTSDPWKPFGKGPWWTRVETTTPQEAEFVAKVAELHEKIRAGTGDVDALRAELHKLHQENRELIQQLTGHEGMRRGPGDAGGPMMGPRLRGDPAGEFGAGPARRGGPQGAGDRGPWGDPGPRGQGMLMAMDLDGDGAISRVEWREAFDDADKNFDGFLDPTELSQLRQRGGPGGAGGPGAMRMGPRQGHMGQGGPFSRGQGDQGQGFRQRLRDGSLGRGG